MAIPAPALLDDVPVTLDGNKLWPDGHPVRRHIREMAQIIVRQDGGLTFAVYGVWGSGKTSFLRMVEEEIRRLNQEPPEIFCCWYEAKKYEPSQNAAKTIIQRILRTLAGEVPEEEAVKVYESFISEMLGPAMPETREGSPTPFEQIERLGERVAALADMDIWLQRQLAGKGPPGVGKRKLVLFVDELDRCGPGFVVDVMDTIQRLGAVPGLFILIGADREKLWSAMESHYSDPRGAQWILEKYIQWAVDLPPLDEEQLSQFLKVVLEERAEGDPSVDVIINGTPYFISGLRDKTPRTLKRCINAVWPFLRLALDERPDMSHEEKMLLLKERILAYQWRDFYEQYFLPAKRDSGSVEYRVFHALERLCERRYEFDLYGEDPWNVREQLDRPEFDWQLGRIERLVLEDKRELNVPDALAKLLGQPPFWFWGREKAGVGKEVASTSFRKKEEPARALLDPTSEFTRLYLQSEQADAVGDSAASAQAAEGAYRLVAQNKNLFGASVAPQLGNLGVNAEKAKAVELAERLFRLALELDPNHGGVLQQFASFIIDNRPDLYDEAEALLSKLRTGSLARHNPWRTLGLLAELKAKRGEELDDALVQEMLRAVQEEEPSARQLGYILNGLIKAGRIEDALRLLNESMQRIADPKSRYIVSRIVADALASRPEIESEYIAMDMYRQMLSVPEALDPGDEADILHNYATLLYKHDYDDEAGRLWFRAYQMRPHDGSIRRAYSLYLLRANRPDLAQKVAEALPLEEEILIPSTKKLPDRFSDVELPPLC